MTEIYIRCSVLSVGRIAFSGSGLTAVTLRDGVGEIAENAFYDCEKLGAVTIEGTETAIGERNFLLMNKKQMRSRTRYPDQMFVSCGATVTLPRGSKAEQYCMDNGIAYEYAD